VENKFEISICIPAYKNIVFLERLLDSISIQTFKNYEVIITDDSPDDIVEMFLTGYRKINNLNHFKNPVPLGTPENWNEGIRRASGRWVKLMHDDDWFSTKNALQIFVNATKKNPECQFFFSAFQNVFEETGERRIVRCNFFDRLILFLNPLHLFKRVYVGNPSCTFIRRDVGELYDKRFKFVVDFEYYIRIIRNCKSYEYIDKVLLSIGFNSEQVTKYTFLVPDVQIPENLLLLQKLGPAILRNILVYDYFWRMVRNLKVRSVAELETYYPDTIHPILVQMIDVESAVSLKLLKNGIVSKILMVTTYIRSLLIPAE
jgi:glycosyltransferase involved in cell wall biosynthesis